MHEVNRQFLHPLGLALAVEIGDDGTYSLAGVWDYRDDPKGIVFSDGTLNVSKAKRVTQEQHEKAGLRQVNLGYSIQPLPEESTDSVSAATEERIDGIPMVGRFSSTGVRLAIKQESVYNEE